MQTLRDNPYWSVINYAEITAAYTVDRSLLGECKGVDCDSPVAIMHKANSTAQVEDLLDLQLNASLLFKWYYSISYILISLPCSHGMKVILQKSC